RQVQPPGRSRLLTSFSQCPWSPATVCCSRRKRLPSSIALRTFSTSGFSVARAAWAKLKPGGQETVRMAGSRTRSMAHLRIDAALIVAAARPQDNGTPPELARQPTLRLSNNRHGFTGLRRRDCRSTNVRFLVCLQILDRTRINADFAD